MQYKGLFYYIIIWLLPILSAVAAFFVDSVGLGITLLIASSCMIIYMFLYIKSIKIKINGDFLVVNRGRIVKQTFYTPKSHITCIKTVIFKIIRARSIIIIAPNLKIFIPFLKSEQIEKILDWYKDR